MDKDDSETTRSELDDWQQQTWVRKKPLPTTTRPKRPAPVPTQPPGSPVTFVLVWVVVFLMMIAVGGVVYWTAVTGYLSSLLVFGTPIALVVVMAMIFEYEESPQGRKRLKRKSDAFERRQRIILGFEQPDPPAPTLPASHRDHLRGFLESLDWRANDPDGVPLNQPIGGVFDWGQPLDYYLLDAARSVIGLAPAVVLVIVNVAIALGVFDWLGVVSLSGWWIFGCGVAIASVYSAGLLVWRHRSTLLQVGRILAALLFPLWICLAVVLYVFAARACDSIR